MSDGPTTQGDLFGAEQATDPKVLREEERFGKADAKSGLSLKNRYSKRIFGRRSEAYQRGFREERRKMRIARAIPCG